MRYNCVKRGKIPNIGLKSMSVYMLYYLITLFLKRFQQIVFGSVGKF